MAHTKNYDHGCKLTVNYPAGLFKTPIDKLSQHIDVMRSDGEYVDDVDDLADLVLIPENGVFINDTVQVKSRIVNVYYSKNGGTWDEFVDERDYQEYDWTISTWDFGHFLNDRTLKATDKNFYLYGYDSAFCFSWNMN